MANRTSELVGKIHPSQVFDLDALLRYSSANVPGFPVSPSSFTVSQFGHGQSNPTFLMEAGVGSSAKRYVMRKKPAGKILESAHAVEREFQVLRALGIHTQVAVPKVYCLCTDSSVIGTAFYIMEYLEGRIYVDPRLPGLTANRKRVIYRETANALASIHAVDVDAIGLGKYGRRDNYCKRQVERWAKQYIAATSEGKPEKNPKMFELIDWLRQHIPPEDSSKATSGLVHGDYRIDNLVFHPTEDRVIGILDWELSTLGNKMCDVASSCMHYAVDIDLEKEAGKNEGFEATGIPSGVPSLAEYLADYCSSAGKPWPVAEWKFYVAFTLFRGASIFAGVYNRWIMGNASGGERAQNSGKMANTLIEVALALIKHKSLLPEHPPLVGIEDDGTSEVGGRFVPSKKILQLRNRLVKFMEDHIYPMENEFYKLAHSTERWTIHPEEENLKELAKKEGLWNLSIPMDSAARAKKILFDGQNPSLSVGGYDRLLGAGLSNLEYGYLCEIMGRSLCAPQVFNCGAPDTGNMEKRRHICHQWNKVVDKRCYGPLVQTSYSHGKDRLHRSRT